MISEQYGAVFKKSEYQKIQKTYSIWICPEPVKKSANSIIRYRIWEEEIHGKSYTDVKDYDKMEVIVVNLGDLEDVKGDQALEFLGTVFSIDMSYEEKKKA